MAVKLGSRVKDVISGYTGIVIGRGEYLYGCAQLLVISESLDKDGKRKEGEWIDEQRMQVVDEGVFKNEAASPQSSATAGGPQDAPSSRSLGPSGK